MSFRRLNQKDVDIGKTLPWDIVDETGKLLLRQGTMIQSYRQVYTILSRGMYYVDDYQEACKLRFGEEEFDKVPPFDLIDEVQAKLKLYLNNLDKEHELQARIYTLCRMVRTACRKHPDATLSTILLGERDTYSIRHQIHVAIISEIISESMNLSEEGHLSLIAAALTQNIGMLKLQEELYVQEEPLSYEQFQMVKSHPEGGAKLLETQGITDQRWLEGVRQHHEGLDGKGYPLGLKGEEITPIARLISISDFFCAKISGRSYRTPMTPYEAMQFVFSGKDSRIDSNIADLFVKVLGIYLPGTLVRLGNGEIAVVTHRGEKVHYPEVFGIMGPNGKLLLAPLKRDCSKSEYQITEVVVPGKIDMKVNRYLIWGYKRYRAKEQ